MRSGYKIEWTDSATIDLQNIIDYLLRKWTNKEVKNFVRKLDRRLNLISINPQLFPKTSKKLDLRRSYKTYSHLLRYFNGHDKNC